VHLKRATMGPESRSREYQTMKFGPPLKPARVMAHRALPRIRLNCAQMVLGITDLANCLILNITDGFRRRGRPTLRFIIDIGYARPLVIAQDNSLLAVG
jgi:hypothetical protein